VEALLLIGERKPDLLILDILMPGMNGIEVCQKLRSSPVTRGIKIAAVTGDHSPDTRKRVLEAGADLFFAKPLDIAEFLACCRKLLGS
jgi:DNA-binding response OmpR family regulator